MSAFGKKIVEPQIVEKPASVSEAPLPDESRMEEAVAAMNNAAREVAMGPQKNANDLIRDQVLLRIEPAAAVKMAKPELTSFVDKLVSGIANEERLLLNQYEQDMLSRYIVDEMIGLGPIEPLLEDPTVGDIMINGPYQIYVERRGKLELTDLKFRHNAHVLHVAQRIASGIGRSVDESSPLLDARLPDGSRVNVVIPPLALKGACISIRKFSNTIIGFPHLVSVGTASPGMARVLEICALCGLNMIISGGTGSGKTTLLNAISRTIDPGERIVTIEDAAELKLQQDHVIQLETRPTNIEGKGSIDQRDLVRNALRMRPDRIIIGEVRGPEAFDMMQAMNTGHDGSMSTIHSNSARDAISRIETMIVMANMSLPVRAIRTQISRAIDVVIQIERMRDGVRRITEIAEVQGLEEDTIIMNTIFEFQFDGLNRDGTLKGEFVANPTRPKFMPRLEYYGVAGEFLDAIGITESAGG